MSDLMPKDARYAKLVDHYSRYIKSPVQRLKFLNNALRATPPRDWMMKFPLVGTLPERAMLIVELSKVLPPHHPAPIALRLTSLLYRIRHAVYAVCLMLTLAMGAGLVYVISKAVGSLSVSTEARNVVPPKPSPSPREAGVEAVTAIGSEAGLTLDKVWLAETGDGYEFYSNGARVLTEYETLGEGRSFYRFEFDALMNGSDEFEILSNPVGVVYHLSEGDLLPFADRYNSSLQNHSKALLEYAKQNRLYNYLIDRFGRTYRIVRDEYASNHAGNSVWSDGRSVYVNLSSSFIGICFEGKSGSGPTVGPDGINEAQIYAARVLTAVLRSKYAITDANCVTHGLVSVNPSNKLMGYHTDWVSNFPFEALGLTSKYDTELVAISRFGFTYDQAYIAAAGGRRWPGLERADAALKESARRDAAAFEGERRAQWQAFHRAYSKQRKLDENRTEDLRRTED